MEYGTLWKPRDDHYIPASERWPDREVKKDYSEFDGRLLAAAVIFLVSAIIFAVCTIFHLTDVAHAEDRLNWRDVHTEAQACEFLRENPGAIKNVTWCNV